jgi:hypothetical protein
MSQHTEQATITYLFGLEVPKAADRGADAISKVSEKINFIFE